MSNEQPPIDMLEAHEPSEEEKQTAQIFKEMRSNQLDLLDQSGKSLIERIATFLTVLFAITAFGDHFPPKYLGNLPAKIMVAITVISYFFAMAVSFLMLQPRRYSMNPHDIIQKAKKLEEMRNSKLRRFWIASFLFALGSAALVCLILFIIWNV